MRRITAASLALAALVTAGTSAFLVPKASAEELKFFDPSTKRWISYRPSRAALAEERRKKFARREVPIDTKQPAGTVIVDTNARYLYLVEGDGKAMRYGIGVGREGFRWSGQEKISRKAEWPGWTPPAEMVARQPDLPRYMPGGPGNPLGARAFYLGSTLYRIHGSNEPWTIGEAVSSGCIRMVNDDVIDLYDRVPVGSRVVVIGPGKDSSEIYTETTQTADSAGKTAKAL
ncbi:L,D-transpeptidase [Segnochrobactraceae bacterium EtOH-i3]